MLDNMGILELIKDIRTLTHTIKKLINSSKSCAQIVKVVRNLIISDFDIQDLVNKNLETYSEKILRLLIC